MHCEVAPEGAVLCFRLELLNMLQMVTGACKPCHVVLQECHCGAVLHAEWNLIYKLFFKQSLYRKRCTTVETKQDRCWLATGALFFAVRTEHTVKQLVLVQLGLSCLCCVALFSAMIMNKRAEINARLCWLTSSIDWWSWSSEKPSAAEEAWDPLTQNPPYSQLLCTVLDKATR